AAITIASIRSSLWSARRVLPASIGPPDTNTVGMLSRSAAISMPGVILSQLEMHTSASAQCALTMYSTASAISSRLGSEYSMPSWPMAMPSSTAMVLNSLATPPTRSISRATSWPRSLRWTWPGTNWVKELAIATIGLWKSSSRMPVARHSAGAPARLRPWVEVLGRYSGGELRGEGDDAMRQSGILGSFRGFSCNDFHRNEDHRVFLPASLDKVGKPGLVCVNAATPHQPEERLRRHRVVASRSRAYYLANRCG